MAVVTAVTNVSFGQSPVRTNKKQQAAAPISTAATDPSFSVFLEGHNFSQSKASNQMFGKDAVFWMLRNK